MRFVPVKLRLADVAVFDEANERDALEFTPTCFSISFLQVTKDPDSLVNRNGFDLGEFADDLEVHARKILSRPLLPQTLLLEATNPLCAPGIAVGLRFIITRSAVPTANLDATVTFPAGVPKSPRIALSHAPWPTPFTCNLPVPGWNAKRSEGKELDCGLTWFRRYRRPRPLAQKTSHGRDAKCITQRDTLEPGGSEQ